MKILQASVPNLKKNRQRNHENVNIEKKTQIKLQHKMKSKFTQNFQRKCISIHYLKTLNSTIEDYNNN